MTQQRNCPECGCDKFKAQDYDKLVKEMEEISSRYKKARASWAELSAADEIKIIKLEEGMKWLQRKAKKQAQAITRLETKLRKHCGELPYAEEPGEFVVKVRDDHLVIEEL